MGYGSALSSDFGLLGVAVIMHNSRQAVVQEVSTSQFMHNPIWTPGQPSHFGERFFYFSPKNRRLGSASSKLEHERRLLLEYDDEVLAFCEQPTEACAKVDGVWRKSRFDYWVSLRDGSSRFEETKYSSELKDPDSRAHAQIRTQKIASAAFGYGHMVVTEVEIWSNPVLIVSLRRLLHEFSSQYIKLLPEIEYLVDRILQRIATEQGVTVASVLESVPADVSMETYRLALMELIRCRRVDASLELIPFGGRSPLRWSIQK